MNSLTNYVEDGALGSGGFADVVRAVNIVTKEVVALKKSRPAADCLERMRREIEVQRWLVHGNVMQILDWSEDGSWFVMPIASGNLGEMHELKPVRGAALLRLVEDVGAALAAAHRRGLVHRDLTPGNILWLRDRWVVADWGFVKVSDGQQRMKLTRTGVGTECFTAPEVYRDGSTATPGADVYGLGRIVGWLLVGKPLEPNKPVPLDETSPWAQFVRETTHDDPAERPVSIAAALELLKPVVAAVGGETPLMPAGAPGLLDVEQATVNAFKNLLQDRSRPIQLEELVDRETEAAFARLSPEAFPVQTFEGGELLEARLNRFVDSCRTLMGVLVNGCAYGTVEQAGLWTRAVRRIGHPSGEWGGNTAMLQLRYFPLALVVYVAGLAAVSREQWFNLTAVMRAPRLSRTPDESEAPAVYRAAALKVLPPDHGKTLPGRQNKYTPSSDWLFEHLREFVRPLLRMDQDYENAFRRLEYLVAMVYATIEDGGWVPLGRFAWKDAEARRFNQPTFGETMLDEVKSQGGSWGPLRGGLFSSTDSALRAAETVEKLSKQNSRF